MRVILMGPPGAGKGTQAERLASRHGLAHLATGVMLRSEIDSGSLLGKAIAEVIDCGGLVDDAMALRLISDRIASGRYVLDGFPRTLAQALLLDELTSGAPIQSVIRLTVDAAELEARMEARVRGDVAAGRRPRADDTVATFRDRQRLFWDVTAPIYAHYEAQGKLVEVDGMRSPDEVSSAIDAVVSKIA